MGLFSKPKPPPLTDEEKKANAKRRRETTEKNYKSFKIGLPDGTYVIKKALFVSSVSGSCTGFARLGTRVEMIGAQGSELWSFGPGFWTSCEEIIDK